MISFAVIRGLITNSTQQKLPQLRLPMLRSQHRLPQLEVSMLGPVPKNKTLKLVAYCLAKIM